MSNSDSEPERDCATCGMPCKGEIKCKGCDKLWYCSNECREANWDYHFFTCKPLQPKHSGFHLVRAVALDQFPDDVQTQLDFGFSRCRNDTERSHLLGLYTGLIKFMGIRAKVLYRWKNTGVLAQRIKSQYEALKPGERGDYYEWFVRNMWVLDDSIPVPTRRERTPPYRYPEAVVFDDGYGGPIVFPVIALPISGSGRGRRY